MNTQTDAGVSCRNYTASSLPHTPQLAAVADAPASETQYMCSVVGTGRLPEKCTQNYDQHL